MRFLSFKIHFSRIEHFKYTRKDIDNLFVKNTVRTIGRSAFSSSSTKKIRFEGDSTLTRIIAFAFHECTNLETISLPPSLIRIGNNAFEGCSSLRKIRIPKTVKSIGRYAFKD
ncbi:MAG: leucine-rich repeat domain-containing protein, partial [archaeon]